MSEERKTTVDTNICIPCGYIFTEDDDYDTLGAEKPVCCPDCGNEDFVNVAAVIQQRDGLLAALEKYGKHEGDCDSRQRYRKTMGSGVISGRCNCGLESAIAKCKE